MARPAEHVAVYVRLRPTPRPYEGIRHAHFVWRSTLLHACWYACGQRLLTWAHRVHSDGETVTVDFPKDVTAGPINNALDSLTLKFDGVLEGASQESVYDQAARPAVEAALRGVNATLLAYGQTGAGKTFTMCGDGAGAYAHRGLAPRALHHVFREADLRTDRTYCLHVSALEIHNEVMRDLLAPASPPGSGGSAACTLVVAEDASGGRGPSVRGQTLVPVASEEEALAQFFLAAQARATDAHALNSASSRRCAMCVHV